jgi:transcriptional regulator with XRE-family HTH domain
VDASDEGYVYGLVLGRVIASLRERRGLSQGELADAAGITQSTISRMERGQAQPDAFTLTRLAGALGVSVADITTFTDRALERSRQATLGAIGATPPKSKPWWQAALTVAGAAGLAGLVAFAVSAALDDPSRVLGKAKAKPKPKR